MKSMCLRMVTIKDFLLMKTLKTINKLKIQQDIPDTFNKMKTVHITWINNKLIIKKKCTLIPAISNHQMKNGIKTIFSSWKKSNFNITSHINWKVN